VEVHAYADRIVIRQDGETVGEHPRKFSRDQTIYDPWHHVPVLAGKPGATVLASAPRSTRTATLSISNSMPPAWLRPALRRVAFGSAAVRGSTTTGARASSVGAIFRSSRRQPNNCVGASPYRLANAHTLSTAA